MLTAPQDVLLQTKHRHVHVLPLPLELPKEPNLLSRVRLWSRTPSLSSHTLLSAPVFPGFLFPQHLVCLGRKGMADSALLGDSLGAGLTPSIWSSRHYSVSFCTLYHHTRQGPPGCPFFPSGACLSTAASGFCRHPPLPHPCSPPVPEPSRSYSQLPVTQEQGLRSLTFSSAPGLHFRLTSSMNILRSWIPSFQRQTPSLSLLLCWHSCSSTTGRSQCCSDSSSKWRTRTWPQRRGLGGGVVQPAAGLSTQIISLRSFTAAKAEASTSRAPDAGGRGDYPSGRLAAADTDPDGHRPQLPYQHPRTKGRGHADRSTPQANYAGRVTTGFSLCSTRFTPGPCYKLNRAPLRKSQGNPNSQ